jgi:hypothetical protein
MNQLLQNYLVDVEYPEVSGIEQLQMLKRRSELVEVEHTLSLAEKKSLAEADRKLALQADKVLAELSRFVNLENERERLQPQANEWWWYLDVLVRAPALPTHAYQLVMS